MITNTGKTIISKYLIGQAPAYASYMAVGCGQKPLLNTDSYGNYSTKENLSFEMFRVPISSRGFVVENGVSKLVLTAELPTEERYEISEIGLYSAGSNPSAGAYDSKTVFAFTQAENWQYHSQSQTIAIPTYSSALDGTNNDNNIIYTDNAFQTNADNSIFYNTTRANRYERCRFLNNTILIKGNDANITKSGNHFVINPGSNHIHLFGIKNNVDFTKNSPIDELRMAISVISKNGNSSAYPDTVRVLVEIANDEVAAEYARFEIELTHGSNGVDFSTNRYYVINKQLQQLYYSSGFKWDSSTVVKIYACAIKNGSPSSDYFVALDALRLENIATVNPLYGLTGYSVIKNINGTTIIKSPNTTNYVEFRVALDVS